MDNRPINLSGVIAIPNTISFVLRTLEAQGYEAYCVGGSVRDSLLGIPPSDWDVTTSALPEQVVSCFPGHSVIPTGLQHGTVSLLVDNTTVEITTYRVDGTYSDNRRPDSVLFTTNIKDDLSRRDFTINAIAYHPARGLSDPYGGVKDLSNGLIRCVGEASHRFEEDPLRILRAFRFSSALGFTVEQSTKQAMRAQQSLLHKVAVERIQQELNKALLGEHIELALVHYGFLLFEVLPELQPMVDFPQAHPYHIYDVWEHTIKSVAAAEKDLIIRLAMLLHDSGKPAVHSIDEDGIAHFYGHNEVSHQIASNILRRLRYCNYNSQAVKQLVLYHDIPLEPHKRSIMRLLRRQGEEFLPRYLAVRRADILAQAPKYQDDRLQELDEIQRLSTEIYAKEACFSLEQLAVDGNNLLDLGVPQGKEVGRYLNALVDLVVEEILPNDKEALTAYVRKCISS